MSPDLIPVGTSLRRELDRLAGPSLTRALDLLTKATFNIADADSLHADSGGGIYYACRQNHPVATVAGRESVAVATAATLPATAAASVPIAAPPLRHSRPGCAKVLFLDFNGAVVTNTAWNQAADTRPAVVQYDCLPFDIDGNATDFSDYEQSVMVEIWERVAEDYAPFDVDVTTEEPAVFSSTTAHAVITRPKDRMNLDLPHPTSGGVAYLDIFGYSNTGYYRPAFIYFPALPENGTPRADYIAESISHELGHNLGLSHDGATKADGTTDEYYDGHENGALSWGTIMGTGYDRHITQWSKGEYYHATNTEDDLAILDAHLGRKTDDFGSSLPSAAPLALSSAEIATTAAIESAGDCDVFRFYAAPGWLSLTAEPRRSWTFTFGSNADLTLELLDSSGGGPLLADNPALLPSAHIGTMITVAGFYYARVSSAGTGNPAANPPTGFTAYGSLGHYTLTLQREIAELNRTASPTDAACLPGGTATFTASFAGTPTPTLSWQYEASPDWNWTEVTADGIHEGVNTGTLTLRNVPASFATRMYRCTAANGKTLSTESAWLRVHFTWALFRASRFSEAELLDPTVSGPDADPDHDGLSNYSEYAYGRNPRAADAAVPLLALEVRAGESVLTFRRYQPNFDLTYSLRVSSDLRSWSWIGEAGWVQTSTPLGGSLYQVEIHVPTWANTGCEFYRLGVDPRYTGL